jgi:hypothetical protein
MHVYMYAAYGHLRAAHACVKAAARVAAGVPIKVCMMLQNRLLALYDLIVEAKSTSNWKAAVAFASELYVVETQISLFRPRMG